jgi:hypothetical protein
LSTLSFKLYRAKTEPQRNQRKKRPQVESL